MWPLTTPRGDSDYDILRILQTCLYFWRSFQLKLFSVRAIFCQSLLRAQSKFVNHEVSYLFSLLKTPRRFKSFHVFRKQIFLVFFLLNIFLINGAAVKEISCENFKTDEDTPSEGHKECFLMNQTVINSPGFVLISPTDENVVAVKFAYNKNIKYLPQSVHEAFPALTIYDAAACAIKSISNVNFANLGKLTTIFLDGNLIESIENGTFEGLNSLKRIFISKT